MEHEKLCSYCDSEVNTCYHNIWNLIVVDVGCGTKNVTRDDKI